MISGVRRKERGFLSTAMYRNGGDYPENAVKERAKLGKFSCVLLCLILTSYLSNLPTTTVVHISPEACGRISSTHEQNKLRVYFCFRGLAIKFLGFCVLGLKYHVLALKWW